MKIVYFFSPAVLVGAGCEVVLAPQPRCWHRWDSCKLFAYRYTGRASEGEKSMSPASAQLHPAPI